MRLAEHDIQFGRVAVRCEQRREYAFGFGCAVASHEREAVCVLERWIGSPLRIHAALSPPSSFEAVSVIISGFELRCVIVS